MKSAGQSNRTSTHTLEESSIISGIHQPQYPPLAIAPRKISHALPEQNFLMRYP